MNLFKVFKIGLSAWLFKEFSIFRCEDGWIELEVYMKYFLWSLNVQLINIKLRELYIIKFVFRDTMNNIYLKKKYNKGGGADVAPDYQILLCAPRPHF